MRNISACETESQRADGGVARVAEELFNSPTGVKTGRFKTMRRRGAQYHLEACISAVCCAQKFGRRFAVRAWQMNCTMIAAGTGRKRLTERKPELPAGL